VGSLAGEPELHHPVRGRVKGVHAFERFVADSKLRVYDGTWPLTGRHTDRPPHHSQPTEVLHELEL